MREIKLKVYDPKHKKLILPSENGEDIDLTYADGEWYITGGASLKTLGYKICLYTNKKDKDKTEIYEDDILLYDSGYKERVKFTKSIKDECYGQGDYGESTLSGFYFDGYYGLPKEAKVIGNYNVNPGLLK